MCDVFLVIISAKECQTDVLTKYTKTGLKSYDAKFTAIKDTPDPDFPGHFAESFDGYPVACARRALTEAETRYARMDKDMHAREFMVSSMLVRLQTKKGYEKSGVVKKPAVEQGSYVVQTGVKEYRRNRKHILAVPEPAPAQSPAAASSPTLLATDL
ncbi:unnamed protein product, partial [Porites lobata]